MLNLNHITLLGIDGIGKSTILNKMIPELGKQFSFVSSPSFHEVAGTPYSSLSQALEQVSFRADAKNDIQSKSLIMILQVSLFGKIESAIENKIISFRHPVIDTMVYAPIYLKLLRKDFDASSFHDLLGEEKSLLKPYVEEFLSRNNFKTLVEVLQHFIQVLQDPLPTQIKELSKIFQTTLPAQAIFLDLNPKIVIERIENRDKTLEPHENFQMLNLLRKNYIETLNNISKEQKKFTQKRIELTGNYLEELISLLKHL